MLRDLLREVRRERGLTAKALSLKLGMDKSYISRLERGARTLEVVEFLDISYALGVAPEALFAKYIHGVKRRG